MVDEPDVVAECGKPDTGSPCTCQFIGLFWEQMVTSSEVVG